MTGRGTFEAIVAEVTRGATPGVAAGRLGFSQGLADAVVDEAERLGLLTRFGGTCSGCGDPAIRGCIGCPLTRVGREP